MSSAQEWVDCSINAFGVTLENLHLMTKVMEDVDEYAATLSS